MNDLDKFTKFLKNKTVANIESGTHITEYAGDDSSLPTGDYDHDGGAVKINFTDGSFILVTASEWGSIQYFKSQPIEVK